MSGKADEFAIGDLVVLKAGGPVMAVNSNTSSGVLCKWFAGKKHEQAYFNQATLRPATDADKK